MSPRAFVPIALLLASPVGAQQQSESYKFLQAVKEAKGSVNLVVTNVPGPQFPMYLAGAEMVETYPVPPLLSGFSVSVGVTSYDGAVYYGISADRDSLPDIDVLGQCVRESLDELVDSASESRLRAPRGRKRTPATPGTTQDPPE